MEHNKNISITITSGTILKTLVILIFFTVLFFVRDLVLVVLTAIVIASAIEPLILWCRKYGIARIISVLVVYLVLALSCIILFYFFLPSFLTDLSNFLTTLPKYVDSINLWNPSNDTIFSTGGSLIKGLDFPNSFSLKEIVNNFNLALSNTSQGFIETVSMVFGGVLSFILIIVLSFYFAVQEDGVGKFLRIITPLRFEEYIVDLWKRSQTKIGLWMQGQILLGLIVGVLVYLGLTVLGVKNALLLSILAMVFELIPVFGPILSAIPAIMLGVSDGGISNGFLILGLYLIIQQFENHLIYPLVVKKIVGVPPILVILALIIGAKLAGFLGILLSVPIASALVEYLDDVQKDKIAKTVKVSNA